MKRITLDELSKAKKKFDGMDKELFSKINHIYGLNIVLNEFLPENSWYIVAGKKAYKAMTQFRRK